MGTFSLVLEVTAMADPFGPVSAQAGQIWRRMRDENAIVTMKVVSADAW